MTIKMAILISAMAALVATGATAHAGTITFSGYTWEVRPSGRGGPGPNYWDQDNVSVDDSGCLHLKLTQRNGRWYGSEVYTQKRLGFGRYEFQIVGRVDTMDPNVVVGLFNYPTPDVGPDATHEIDIEFARWGNTAAPMGNYTVWPATNKLTQASKPFPIALNSDSSMHSFTWSATNVFFQSQQGHDDEKGRPFASWLFQPPNPATGVSQKPMPVHINLWCFKGQPPANGQQVEVVIRAFKFAP